MTARTGKRLLLATLGVLIAAGLFALGRLTVGTHPTSDRASQAEQDDSYFRGLRVGEAQGRQEGRVLQEESTLPANSRQPVKDAFNAGYAAGTNDAFAGYDGGWALNTPYVITVEVGSGKIVYRISARTPVEKNVNYYLCPNGRDICQQPR